MKTFKNTVCPIPVGLGAALISRNVGMSKALTVDKVAMVIEIVSNRIRAKATFLFILFCIFLVLFKF
jgi:hypothetical protein